MLARWLVIVFALFALIGCGGKGGGGKNQSAAPFMSIEWPQRSKASTPTVNAPSSAESVSVVCTSLVNNNKSSLKKDRQSVPQSYLDNVVLSNSLPIGHVSIVINFYSQPGEQGVVVATAQSDATIDNLNGSLVDGNGNPLVVSIATVIKTVEITAPTGSSTTLSPSTGVNLPVGQTVQLGFNAYDANNALVAVTPGSGIFQAQAANIASVTQAGLVTSIKAGTSLIACSVDGITNTGQWQFTANVPIVPTATISWGARTRAISLNSAESVQIAVTSVPPAGSSYAPTTCTINQDRNLSTLSTFTQTVVGTTALPIGQVTINATFYDKPGEAGEIVGTLSLPITGSADPQMTSAGVLQSSTGQAITINGNTNVATVAIDPPTPLTFDSALTTQASETLTFKAFNSSGTQLSNVSAGSGTFSGGGSTVTVAADGTATAKAGGTQTGIICTVDGVASPAVSLAVQVIPTLTVGWGTRTNPPPPGRATLGLSSAESVDLTITPTNGTPVTLTVNRDLTVQNLQAYTQSYPFSSAVAQGSASVSANFYDLPGGAAGVSGTVGDLVGTYTLANATVNATGAVETGTGSSLTVYGNTLIDRIVITAPSQMAENTVQQLTFQAFQGSTPLPHVTAGSASFAVVGTTNIVTVTPSGLVTSGSTIGSQQVNCTIDGVVSGAVTVQVISGSGP